MAISPAQRAALTSAALDHAGVVAGAAGERLAASYVEDAPRSPAGPQYNGPTRRPGVRPTVRLWTAFEHGPAERRQRSVVYPIGVNDRTAPHGKWIDQPVAEIRPVTAPFLSWYSYFTGAQIFARRVVPSRVHEGWWRKFVERRLRESLR